ncbi:AAA family ATPase [Flavobacterium algoritolerans]|uniref:AAA family ATPase n=1 Tax=Flavobacterium algoritolerans TaxID=3041254 RepID=A0ABT6VCU8_9FLAO|nr:AAA family ATPase [Flavobacterium algoritolerans]MDI5896019.1 AAA family ATPase [Flavobacterium algoritolerans]
MKIKSVKITGFRAFEKEADSTFDFTSNGEIMNFASIYAPNGFGKTSFYDAVEWAVTHKIQRFDRMVDFEKVRKDNDAPLLLNKASLSGKVIVETSLNSFENVINKKKVYKYNEKPVNEYFQNQILTQDLIDAFLKEEKADKRYENFIEIDDSLKKYDAIYKKINRLLEYIKEERKSLESKKSEEEKSLQTEIDFEQEFKKFDEINEVISYLKKEDENIDFINQHSFNPTSYDNLSRNIDVRLLSLEEELIKAKLRIDTITLARDGEEIEDNELNGGILSYLDNRNKILKLDEQSKELDQIILWFEQQERLNNELSLNNENVKIEQNRLQRTLNIEKQFESFLATKIEIAALEKNIDELKNKSLVAKGEKLDSEKEKNDATIKLNELKNSLVRNQSILNNIPTQKEQLQATSPIILELEKKIGDLSKLIVSGEKKLNDSKEILDQFGYYENRINDDIELLLEFNLFKEHKELITSYIEGSKKLKDLKSNIDDVQSKIDSQNHFNQELKEFINTGLELVNKSESSDCPLCNHDYDSFEKLSESILSNKLIDSKLKIYLAAKNDNEIELNNLVIKLSSNKEQIGNTFSALKQPYLSEQKVTQNTINKLVLERKEKLNDLNKNQLTLQELLLFFGDQQTPDELPAKIQEDVFEIEKQLLDRNKLLDTIASKVFNIDSLLKTYEENIKISENNLVKLRSSIDYEEVRNFFIEALNSNNFEKSILLERITSIQLIIRDIVVKIEGLNLSLSEINTKLSNYTITNEEYIKKKELVKNTKNLALRIYDNYENYILSEFGIELTGKDKAEIEKEFLDLIEKQKEVEKLIENKKEKFKITRILNDACIKATESKKVQDRIEEINNSLKELDDAEGKLNIERGSLKSFLKNTIEAYFYTPLINAIYEKIDPHPDYKSIEFECDFAENKPRLQIYTWSSNEKGQKVRSVPSLYFSTAQVNILSLSIFLARALKTKDPATKEPVNCIFIDDPIQSMDSINILSFIDLFRGITLSLDKQLIVSTHEENFHLLLKKKIPSDLFKSKFLEFETFGKLKTN